MRSISSTLQHAIEVSNQFKKETEEPSRIYNRSYYPSSGGMKNKVQNTVQDKEQNVEQNTGQNTVQNIGQNTGENMEQSNENSTGPATVSDNSTGSRWKWNKQKP
jgi:hypothetical protein